MRTSEEIRVAAYQALIEKLGILDAEKFIALVQREPFDYTEWQRNLFGKKSALEISHEAAEYVRKTQGKRL